jgi:hypothetical protein
MPLMTQESVPSDERLLVCVRERVSQGRLPRDVPRSILVTRTAEAVCDLCDEKISDEAAAYEIEFHSQVRLIHLHSRCYLVWDSECLEPRRQSESAASENPG